MHGVESDLRGREDGGEAPNGRESLKGGKSVMTLEKGEALCNGFKSEGALCNGFGEKSIAALCDGFEVERDEKTCVIVSSESEPCVTTRVESVVRPCVTVSSESKPCVTAGVESVVRPCVTVPSETEPCVTSRVESVVKPRVMVSSRNELCVTARGDDDQTFCMTDSTNKRPCATEVIDRSISVSSANCIISFSGLMYLFRWIIYIVYRIELRTQPWGTPIFFWYGPKSSWLILKYRLLFVMRLNMNFLIFKGIVIFFNISCKMFGFTLSNADLISIRRLQTYLLVSNAVCMIVVKVLILVEQDLDFLKPFCVSGIRFLFLGNG